MVHLTGMRTTIELDDAPIQTADHDTAIVLPAAIHHRLTSVTTGPKDGLCRWGHLDFRILGGICVLSLFELPHVIPAPRAVALGDRCAELTALVSAPLTPVIGSLHCTGLGLQLLTTIIGDAALNPHGLTLLAHVKRMAPVLAWIDEHLDEPITRGDLARVAGLSPSQFHAIFHSIMRRSPMAYVASRRIERAQVLLVTTALPVQDIATRVGFADPFHFSRVFKRGCGRSPLRYRSEVSLRTI